MTHRERLNRQVPAEAVRAVETHLDGREERVEGDISRLYQKAIVELLPPRHRPERLRDDLDALEKQLQDDLERLGLWSADSRDDSSLKHTGGDPLTRDWSGSTEFVSVPVDADVKAALKKYVVEEEGHDRGVYGKYVADAVLAYIDGGHASRLRRMYEQLREAVDLLPSDRGKRVRQVIGALEPQPNGAYHVEIMKDTIEGVAGVTSATGQRQYIADIVDRHPDDLREIEGSDGNLYAPPETADELAEKIAADKFAPDELTANDYAALDRDDRVAYLREWLRQRAEETNGRTAVTYKDVIRQVFDGHPSTQYAYTLMEEAADGEVRFTYGEHNGQKRLRYDATAEQASREGGSPAPTPTPDADVSASSDADSGGSAATAADGGLALDAATERLRDTFGGKDAPDLVRSEIANVSDGVAPEDVPDDAVREVRERLTAGGMDQLQAAEPANAPSD
jgi:hypothetical protein